MSCGSFYDGGVIDDDEFRLFCTPPPGEMLAELDYWIGDGRDAEGTEQQSGFEAPERADCSQSSSSKKDNLNRPRCTPRHHSPSRKGKISSKTRNQQSSNKCILQLSRSSRMTDTGRSLTSITTPSKGPLVSSANHLARIDSSHSYLATSTSSKLKHDSAVTSAPKQHQGSPSLGQLIGYTSSVKEVVSPPDKKLKKPARSSSTRKFRKKNTSEKLKLAELIPTVSESEASVDVARLRGRTENGPTRTGPIKRRAKLPASKVRTSQRIRQRRTSSTTPEKAPINLIQQSDNSPLPRRKMKNGVGAGSKSTSDGRRKRPASSAASMKDTKLPKTKGGFLMSDESEAEEYDDGSEDDDSELGVPIPPRQRAAVSDRAADVEETVRPPLPTKQLNQARLNMLFGRNKNAQSPLMKNAQSNPAGPRSSSQAAPYKQGNTQNRKLAPVTSGTRRTSVDPIWEAPLKSTVPSGKQGQTQRSIGSASSTSSSQGSKKSLESDSVSGGPSMLNEGPVRLKTSRHQKSQSGAVQSTGPSKRDEKPLKGNSDNAQKVLNGAANVRSTPNTAKTVGKEPSSNSQARERAQNQTENSRSMSTVASSRPSQDRSRQPPQDGKQTHPATAENRIAQQPIHKSPGQHSARQPATQAQNSNNVTASSPLPRGANPSRPQNRNPNTGPTKGQSVANRTPKPGVVHGAQIAQKRKVENISGGPSDSQGPVKKPVVTLKPLSTSAQPTSEGKRRSEAETRSSNLPKAATPAEANKPSARAAPTSHPQPKSLPARSGSHTVPTTLPPSTTSTSRTDKTINESLATPDSAGTTPLNRSQNVATSTKTSIKATATSLSSTSNGSPVPQILLPTSKHEVQRATSTPRQTSKKDFFAPVLNSKGPMASSNESTSKALVETSRASAPPDVMTAAHSRKSLGQSVIEQSNIPLSADLSLATIAESRDVKNGLPESVAVDESVSKSIPAAVLYPSFNPTVTVQLQPASNVSPRDSPATATVVDVSRSEGNIQQTPRADKAIETAIPAATIREDAFKPPAEGATNALVLPPVVVLKTTATQTDTLTSLGNDVASPKPSDTGASICSSVTIHNQPNTPCLSAITEGPEQPEPYFEYAVFQKIWSSEQVEDAVAATEIVVRPSARADEANSLAEQLFENMREQYLKFLHVDFSEWSVKRDSQDCLTISGVFSPYDYPDQTSHVKIWAERNCVSKYANTDRQPLKMTPFIRKEAYVLRLFKVIPAPDASDVESDGQAKPPFHSYHKLPCTEVYTTLDAANRAARTLQVELAHVKNPKDDVTAKWQKRNLADLNAKVHALDPSMGGEEGCWRSGFNACGKGGDRFELVVEKVGIAGPRN